MMKAAFFDQPGRIAVREVDTPRPAPGEVLLRVRNCGVCGSDLHWFHGASPAPTVCPGHEIAGEIVGLGDGVDGALLGRRAAVEPLAVCGQCWSCRSGNHQLCRRLDLFGITRAGGFAEFLTVPAYAVYRLPDGLDFELGSLAEPTAVAVHALRLAALDLGERVLVLGAGTIGLLSVVAARAAGAGEVLATARYGHQAEMARRLGAARVFGPGSGDRGELARELARRPPDVVVETVGGSGETLADSIGWVRAGGRVIVLGVFTCDPPLPALALVVKEVRVIGSMTYSRAGVRSDFEIAFDLLAGHAAAARDLVTARFPLDGIQAAFEAASDKSRRTIKVTVSP